MDYVQFGISTLNAIAYFAPQIAIALLLASAPVIIWALCKLAISLYDKIVQMSRAYKKSQSAKGLAARIQVAKEKEYGDITEGANYYDLRLALEMLGRRGHKIVLLKPGKKGYRRFGLTAISREQINDIYASPDRLEAALSGNIEIVSEGKGRKARNRYLRPSAGWMQEI